MSFNRTREAGHLDEIQDVVANTLTIIRSGASLLANSFGVGFIGWLDRSIMVVSQSKVEGVGGVRRPQRTSAKAMRPVGAEEYDKTLMSVS
jgi:hypothetical protein